MVAITIVEPNTLMRMGLLQLTQELSPTAATQGMDYAELFTPGEPAKDSDLMLLAVPDSYPKTQDLVAAATQNHAPRRILLLSDAETLPYSLLNMPSTLFGYISKHASHDVLTAAITLVLAGGKCFPRPEPQHGHPASEPWPGNTLRRRWYDRNQPPPSLPASVVPHVPNLLDKVSLPGRTASSTQAQHVATPAVQPTPWPMQPELIHAEARKLQLTPRQYEVLALLARGYPLKKVSQMLQISLATAKTHTEALYLRLAVNNRHAAVYTAVSRGATLGCYDTPGQPAP